MEVTHRQYNWESPLRGRRGLGLPRETLIPVQLVASTFSLDDGDVRWNG